MSVRVGSVELPSPVLAASGTAGHGAELAPYVDLSKIGAVVVKSLLAEPWEGNPAPRVRQTPAGMMNSVGLQGPGVPAWIRDELPALLGTGTRVVASIWGRSLDEYRRAAEAVAAASDSIVAVEVNVSCPNVEDRNSMFAHDPGATAAVIEATEACGVPRWAKLSPNVTDLTEIARAAVDAGADALTLVNTLMGLAIDLETRRPALGGGGGGVSGPAIHPVAVRAVYDVRSALPDIPIVGVGGVANGHDAIEMLMAGADAVAIGTALFADPATLSRVHQEMAIWCSDHGVTRVTELSASAHGV